MYTISSGIIISIWYFYIKNITLSVLFMVAYIFEAVLSWIGQVVRGLGKNLNYSLAYAIYSVMFVLILCIGVMLTVEINLKYVVLAMIISYAVSILFLLATCNIKKYICIIIFYKGCIVNHGVKICLCFMRFSFIIRDR